MASLKDLAAIASKGRSVLQKYAAIPLNTSNKLNKAKSSNQQMRQVI